MRYLSRAVHFTRARIISSMLLLLAWVGVAFAPEIPPEQRVPRCPADLELAINIGASSLAYDNACRVEVQMVRAGWNRELVVGALANAWHESGWTATAVGDHGKAVGFWQLHSGGLGHGMSVPRRMNLWKSTDVVIRSSERQKLTKRVFRTPGQASDMFCRKVMRPSNPDKAVRKRHRTAVLVE